jgi:hypothetical protein
VLVPPRVTVAEANQPSVKQEENARVSKMKWFNRGENNPEIGPGRGWPEQRDIMKIQKEPIRKRKKRK